LNRKDTLTWVAFGIVAALAIGGGAVLSGYPGYVTNFAQAIATAEGFYVAGSQPQRKNNPGDIETAGVVNTYGSVSDGWNALYTQVSMMFDGSSAHYSPDMTIEQVGYTYSPAGAENWINNVSSYLGVDRSTVLSSLMS
jgi:hypothetical protein